MHKLKSRLVDAEDGQRGLTLIEVVVAMMIFTVVSIGLLYTLTSLLSVTREGRSRQVASNLAAQEIDLARDVNDVFNLQDVTRNVTLNGDTFQVLRTANWVSSTDSSSNCGAGGGTLQYKRVHVVVTWSNMRPGSVGVDTDTLINPDTRINDPALGTIFTTVLTATGQPVANVTVAAAPSSGATLSATTDAKGCAYMLEVAPSTYTVKLTAPSGTTYVDVAGKTNPTLPATVLAGNAATAAFTYDAAGTLRATYNASTNSVPTTLPTSLVSTRDPVVTAAAAVANPRSILVSPWPDGYSVIAGDTVNCAAADPGQWTASGTKVGGVRPDPVAAASAVTTNVTVPASTISVSGMATSGSTNRYLVAVSQDAAGSGQPACATAQTYRFAASTTTTMTVVLPYGTWFIYRGNSNSFTPASGSKLSSGITGGSGATVSGSGTVVMDPRGTQ